MNNNKLKLLLNEYQSLIISPNIQKSLLEHTYYTKPPMINGVEYWKTQENGEIKDGYIEKEKTHQLENKVNTFIIGAAKTGTTSINNILNQDENISIALNKEPQFFSSNKISSKTELFSNYFKDSSAPRIVDMSVTYSMYPSTQNVAQKIHNYNPNSKIIYLTRDPVDRFVSYYNQFKWINLFVHKSHFKVKDLNDFLKLYPQSLLYSCYNLQIKQYEKYFNNKNILVLKYEDFVNHKKLFFTNLYKFLELPFDINIIRDDVKRNTSSNKNSTAHAVNKTNEYKKKFGPLYNIVKSLIPKSLKNIILNNTVSEITEHEKNLIRNFYTTLKIK